MLLQSEGTAPIYVQISDWLETEILCGNIREDERIYSQYQLADMFNINPATAAKGLNILADEDIIYKKRGLGMFVSPNAKAYIQKKRRDHLLKSMILALITEAGRLEVSSEELIEMIQTLDNRRREGEEG